MGVRFIRISVVYLVIGIALGFAMGIKGQFTLAPVHAHLLLAGWVTMGLAGILYHLYPAAADTGLARVHFWLHNLALPVFAAGMVAMVTGHAELEIVIIVGATALLAGLVAFAVNVWLNVRPAG
jgi:hypothetical protein